MGSKDDVKAAEMLADPYLSQLLSYSLDTFKKEPQGLKSQQSLLREELEETAVLHHKGFINAATCLQEISGKVDAVHQQLHALATDMRDLRGQGESFIVQAKRSQVRSPSAWDPSSHTGWPYVLACSSVPTC